MSTVHAFSVDTCLSRVYSLAMMNMEVIQYVSVPQGMAQLCVCGQPGEQAMVTASESGQLAIIGYRCGGHMEPGILGSCSICGIDVPRDGHLYRIAEGEFACEDCELCLEYEHETLCDRCGQPSTELVTVQDADRSVGYVAELDVCSECAQHKGRL